MKIVDMHCDTISELAKAKHEGRDEGLRENGRHIDLLRMQESGYLLQNFALFVNAGTCKDPWQEVCGLYEIYRQEMAQNSDLIAPVLRYGDIAANEICGKMSAMLAVEEGAVCGGEIARLEELYRMGVRMMTLSWNYPNELCHPHTDAESGLTEKGREFVVWMEHKGMIVDVSHLSDAGFYDVLEMTKKPFVASHSNARSVCRHSRNLSDGMIRKLGERGGCMGLNFYVPFLEEAVEGNLAAGYPAAGNLPAENPPKRHPLAGFPKGSANSGGMLPGMESVVRHARHITNVGGVEVLGLGSDFDGIDNSGALPGAQSMERLWEALRKAGYAQRELDRIFRENVLRVYRACL